MTEDKPFLKPEEFKLKDEDGKEFTYILSNFDCVEGRRIFSQYPMSALPKVGDYEVNEQLMYRIMSYVAVITSNGGRLRLETEALVKNHVPNTEMLALIEIAMMKKNFSFFRDGKILGLFEKLRETFTKSLSETLIQWSLQSAPLNSDLQPTTNSQQSTT